MRPSRKWMITLLTLSVAAGAQEGGEEPAEEKGPPRPEELLARAVHHYRHAESLFVRAEVEHEAAQRAGAGAGPAGARLIIQISSGGIQSPPFEGRVEAWRDRDGVVVIQSEKPLPGFSLYARADRTIRRITQEGEESFSLDQMAAELVPLLDGPRLARHLEAASLRAHPDTVTGDVLFLGEVSRKVVDVTQSGGHRIMIPKVLRVEAAVLVSKEGRFKRIDLEVVRNDPGAEMMRRRGFGLRIQGGAAPQPKQAEKKDEHDIEGVTTTYSLVFPESGPSMRARLFKEQVETLLEGRKG